MILTLLFSIILKRFFAFSSEMPRWIGAAEIPETNIEYVECSSRYAALRNIDLIEKHSVLTTECFLIC